MDPQAGKTDIGLRTLQKSGRTSLVLCFSSLWVTHPVLDFVLLSLYLSYHLIVDSPLFLDLGYIFLVGSRVFQWVVRQLVVILVFSQGEMGYILLLCHSDLLFPGMYFKMKLIELANGLGIRKERIKYYS